jgi:kinesin family protein 18/19
MIVAGLKLTGPTRYAFDHIFRMQATQEEVFTRTALPLLPGVLDGFNATVFAYGVSRSNRRS